MRAFFRHVRGFATATIAAALGGALVGVGESLFVTWTSAAANEYWLFLFGAVVYGLIGAVLGLGGALVWQVVRRGSASDRQLAQLGGALAIVLPVFAVARYNVAQRLYQENLPTLTTEGLVVHLLLVAGALLAAGIGLALMRD
jgi:hypothetical protein